MASRPITSGRTSLWAGRKLRQHGGLSWRRGFHGTRAGGCRGVRTAGKAPAVSSGRSPPLRALDPAGPAVGACARTLGNPGPRLQTVGVCAERHRVLLPAFGTGREFKASGNG